MSGCTNACGRLWPFEIARANHRTAEIVCDLVTCTRLIELALTGLAQQAGEFVLEPGDLRGALDLVQMVGECLRELERRVA